MSSSCSLFSNGSFSHVNEALDLMVDYIAMERAGDEAAAEKAEKDAGEGSPLGDDGFAGVKDPELDEFPQEEL